jgi:hypothetical protein
MFHLRPKPRPPQFLGDHHHARMVRVHRGGQLLQEVDRLQVGVAAEDVRAPLPVVAGVVEVEHGGDGVDA